MFGKNLSSLSKLSVVSLLLLSLLSGCGNSGGSGTSPAGNATQSVSIDEMTSVPVINGSSTKGTLYIHNNGDKPATNVYFELNRETKSSQFKGLLSKLGLSSNSVMVNDDGFTLINSELCSSIPAGGSCVINFSTPNLSVGNSGSSLVSLRYSSAGKQYKTNQVVNYNYVNIASGSGVNFNGSINASIPQGKTGYVVGYLYGSGEAGTKYSNVSLTNSANNVEINNGFINNQEVAAGQVIAVEYAVHSQNSTATTISVTPNWSGSAVYSANRAPQSVGSSNNVGVPLQVVLNPSASTINFAVGTIPVLTAPTTSNAVVYVTNNGNSPTGGGTQVIRASSSNPALTVSQGTCATTQLQANAGNTCTFEFSTTSSSPGSATVTYSYGTTTVGTVDVYWVNNKPVPMVSIVPSTSFESLAINESKPVVFTLTNFGKAPLESMVLESTIMGSSTWLQESTSCGTSLATGATCTVTGKILAGFSYTYGTMYYRALGKYAESSYEFLSLPVKYTVPNSPVLTISPNGVNMLISANGSQTQVQTYTLTNSGTATAPFSYSLILKQPQIAVNPSITGGTCTTAGGLLAESSSCTFIVTFGPAAHTLTTNESNSATLSVDYSGGIPNIQRNVQTSFDYAYFGNDIYLAVTSVTASGITGGDGESSTTPYTSLSGTSTPMKLVYNYKNMSESWTMTGLNLNTNHLPFGWKIESSTTCPTGESTFNLPKQGTCKLVYVIDKTLLNNSPTGGSTVLNFESPTATWTTSPFGQFTQSSNVTIYANYLQPTITFTLSNNNAIFESTVLTMTATNVSAAVNKGLNGNVWTVDPWLVNPPTEPSANCVVSPGDTNKEVSCDLKTTTVGSVKYIMPNYLTKTDGAQIPLKFSTNNGQYAYLDPSYTFINLEPPALQWYTVGTEGISESGAAYQSLIVVGSTPYVAYSDYAHGGKTTVMKYNGVRWEVVGNVGFSESNATYQSLAADPSGTLYVAYSDYANGKKTTVMTFDGNSWANVGNAGFSDGVSKYVSLAINSDGVPYVAYSDAANNDKNTVMKFTNNVWSVVGTAGFDSRVGISPTTFQSLGFNSLNVPYLAFAWRSARNASTMRFDEANNTWESIGGFFGDGETSEFTSLAFNSLDVLYVASSFDISHPAVSEYDPINDDWNTVSGGYIGTNGGYYSLKITLDDILLLGFCEGCNGEGPGGFTTVYYYDQVNNAWLNLGQQNISGGNGLYQSLAIDLANDIPYIAYQDEAADFKTTVKRYSVN